MKRYLLNIIALGILLATFQSCKKNEEKPSLPYYQFTDADLLWLNFKIGDEWVFETLSGKQQKYIVSNIVKNIKESYVPSNFGGIISGGSRVTYYYDRVKIDVKRLDTLDSNTLEFKRAIPAGADQSNPPIGNGEFKLGGIWRNYLGGFIFQDVFGNINISAAQLALQNIQSATINGRNYTNVAVINGVPNIAVPGKPYIETIYYAQREGIVRMISKSGEVWDRIP